MTSERVKTLPAGLRQDNHLTDGIYVRERHAKLNIACTKNQDENTYLIGECSSEDQTLPETAFINDATGDVYIPISKDDYLKINRKWGFKEGQLTSENRLAEAHARVLGAGLPENLDRGQLVALAKATQFWLDASESLYFDLALNTANRLIQIPELSYRIRTELVGSMAIAYLRKGRDDDRQRVLEFGFSMLFDPKVDANDWVSMMLLSGGFYEIPKHRIINEVALNLGAPAAARLHISRYLGGKLAQGITQGIMIGIATDRGIDAETRLLALQSLSGNRALEINTLLDMAHDINIATMFRLEAINRCQNLLDDTDPSANLINLSQAVDNLLSNTSLTPEEKATLGYHFSTHYFYQQTELRAKAIRLLGRAIFLQATGEKIYNTATRYHACTSPMLWGPIMLQVAQDERVSEDNRLGAAMKALISETNQPAVLEWLAHFAQKATEQESRAHAALTCFNYSQDEEQKREMVEILEKEYSTSKLSYSLEQAVARILLFNSASKTIQRKMVDTLSFSSTSFNTLLSAINDSHLPNDKKILLKKFVVEKEEERKAYQAKYRLSVPSVAKQDPNFNLAVVIQ
ncbi:MAG: hypothetical protein Q7T03_04840 [Deltaproteobacteria bacterium]|nr:hypothetical protein [Deltaproteobacteria bacterium]